EGPWLSQLDDVSVGHGVSLLRWRSGGVEHPHDTPPYPFMPSPTSAHSSSHVNYKNSSTYSYSAEGSSLLRTTLKPVPPPARLIPRIVTVDATKSPPTVTFS